MRFRNMFLISVPSFGVGVLVGMAWKRFHLITYRPRPVSKDDLYDGYPQEMWDITDQNGDSRVHRLFHYRSVSRSRRLPQVAARV